MLLEASSRQCGVPKLKTSRISLEDCCSSSWSAPKNLQNLIAVINTCASGQKIVHDLSPTS
jgi:hypothetical protein